MARINQASLRAQLDDCRAQFDAIKQKGEASADTLALINALFMLVDIVVAVFLEKTTPRTSRNSSLPSSRDGTDEGETHTAGSGSRSRGPKARHARSDTLRTVTTTHTSPVTECRQCGHDLTGTACTGHEQRIEVDIVFETVERRVTAEIKNCPRCHTRTKGSFPDTMPGPLQYGPGIVAYVVHPLCAQMVSLKRTAGMIQAMTGRLLSEATLLGFVSRLHQALEPWEAAAIGKLLDMPVLHVDETSLRVDRKNYWIHVCAGGPITVKGLHRNRGCEAINTLGIIPRYGGLIVHDCWKAYLTYTQCKHQLCGAHPLRELQAVTDSNGYPWARKMHKLLLIARRQVIQRPQQRLSMRHYKRIARCYKAILEQGRTEMPEIPPPKKGQRGPVAKSDAHNLHQRLVVQRKNVLRFTRRADTPFTNNRTSATYAWQRSSRRSPGASEPYPSHTPTVESRATSRPWRHSATTPWSPSPSPCRERPSTASTRTPNNHSNHRVSSYQESLVDRFQRWSTEAGRRRTSVPFRRRPGGPQASSLTTRDSFPISSTSFFKASEPRE